MRNRILGALIVVLLVIGAVVFRPRAVQLPGPALIDTSMLLPGMNCQLTLASATDREMGVRQYSGVVAEVNPTEIILDDAAYEEGAAAEVRQHVGTAHVPTAEIAVIRVWGIPLAEGRDGVERIGIQFR